MKPDELKFSKTMVVFSDFDVTAVLNILSIVTKEDKMLLCLFHRNS